MTFWSKTLGRLFGSPPRAALTSADLGALIGGGGVTLAGVPVTPENSLQISAVLGCVKVLSESVAQLPIILYRRTKDGGRERADDHPLWHLLHVAPNGWQTIYDFVQMQQAHLTLRGNAYALKTVVRGEVRELLPIPPGAVSVKQNDDWSLEYAVNFRHGRKEIYSSAEVLHLRGLSTDGVQGLSPIEMARQTMGLTMRAEQFGAQLFGNGARPSGIISTEQRLTAEQIDLIRKSWQAAHGGENAMGTAIMDGGFKFSPLTMSNEDAQFLELRNFQVKEIARIFRVPPHMIADLSDATFSNVEHMSLEFVQFTLMPWLKQWESRLSMALLTPAERQEYFVEFLVDGLLRGDVRSRYEAYQIGKQNGFLSANDIRRKENMEPIDGGDVYQAAANLFGAKNAPDPANA